MRIKKFMGMKLDKKMSDRATFTARLLILSTVFFAVWMMRPTFPLMKAVTANVISVTTGSEIIVESGVFYLTKNGFSIELVTDCVGWKELAVFLSLFISWPKKKSWKRALYSIGVILVYNILRLDFLLILGNSFDYFHPGLQLVSMAVIIGLWLWSVGIIGGKLKTRKSKTKKKPRKKPKKRKTAKKSKK